MFEVDEQVGQLVLDRLERADRPAELQPRLRVLDRQVEQVLARADLFDGQQRRTHLQRVLDDAVGFACAGHQPARRSRTTRRWPAAGSGRAWPAGCAAHPTRRRRRRTSATPSAPLAATSRSSAAPASTTRSTVPVSASPSTVTATSPSEPGLVGHGERRGPAALDKLGQQARRAPRPPTPRPAQGSRGRPCRTAARMPATRPAPRPRPPGRQGCRRPRRRLPAPKARARRARRRAASTPSASNGGSDSISVRTDCSSKFSAQNLRTAARNWPCSSVKMNSAT